MTKKTYKQIAAERRTRGLADPRGDAFAAGKSYRESMSIAVPSIFRREKPAVTNGGARAAAALKPRGVLGAVARVFGPTVSRKAYEWQERRREQSAVRQAAQRMEARASHLVGLVNEAAAAQQRPTPVAQMAELGRQIGTPGRFANLLPVDHEASARSYADMLAGRPTATGIVFSAETRRRTSERQAKLADATDAAAKQDVPRTFKR